MLRTYGAFMPCSATSQNTFPIRPSPTGVRLGLPVFRPFVSSNAYPGQGQTNREREPDRRVQHVFLKRVENAVFHFESFAHITLMSRFSRTGFGKPRIVTFSMARPTHSVVVT